MFAHVTVKQCWRVLALTMVLACAARGADRRPVDPAIPILSADDPGSIVAIEGPWGDPIYARVVTLADVPAASLLVNEAIDPARPVRIPTTLQAPDGSVIHVNIVEIGYRSVERKGRTATEWTVNTDPPFCVAAELAAAVEGRSIRQQRAISRGTTDDEPVCYVTGVPIVELYVWFAPDTTRTVAANYGVQVVPSASVVADSDGGSNGMAGSGDVSLRIVNPVPPDGGFSGGNPNGGDPTDGADPIGSPDDAHAGG